MIFPKGTMTYTGAGIATAGPILTAVLTTAGIGECTPEQLGMGCVGASQWAGILITIFGAGLAWLGRLRAAKHAAAAIADAAKQQG